MKHTLTLFILSLCTALGSAAEPLELNVRAFGAKGDGSTDDTAAFHTAIAEGAKLKLPVRVPQGSYVITQPLALNAQRLTGEPNASFGADVTVLPTLVVRSESGTAIRLGEGATVDGLQIHCSWPGGSPGEKAAPAIELAGPCTRIHAMRIISPWVGIGWDGKSITSRTTIENILMGSVHKKGVHIGNNFDVTVLRNIEVFSPDVPRFAQEGIGFHLQKCDDIRLSDCFVISAQTGYLFDEEKPGVTNHGTWGTLVNCSSDYITGVSLDIVGEHKLTFSAGSHLSHHLGLRVREKGAVVAVNGVWIQCSSAPTIQVEGGRSIAVTGCTLDRRHESFGAPAVMIGGGEIVSITGNTIDSQGTGLHLRPGCERLVYSSNAVRFKGQPVTDQSGGQGRLVLQGNAEEPITAKPPEAAPPAKQ